jgi:antiviral helicase SKI2
MRNAVTTLSSLVSGWLSEANVPEVDWSRIRLLDFQELLRERNHLADQLNSFACVLCEDFATHVRH